MAALIAFVCLTTTARIERRKRRFCVLCRWFDFASYYFTRLPILQNWLIRFHRYPDPLSEFYKDGGSYNYPWPDSSPVTSTLPPSDSSGTRISSTHHWPAPKTGWVLLSAAARSSINKRSTQWVITERTMNNKAICRKEQKNELRMHTLPLSMTTIRSHVRIVSSLCAMVNTVQSLKDSLIVIWILASKSEQEGC